MPFVFRRQKMYRLKAKFTAILLIFGVIFGISIIPSVNAATGVPRIVSYQGRLLNASGTAQTGTFYFKFSIWDNATVLSGNRLWPVSAPDSVALTLTSGVFNVNIGDTVNGFPNVLDYNFNTNQDIFLKVEASSDNASFETLS